MFSSSSKSPAPKSKKNIEDEIKRALEESTSSPPCQDSDDDSDNSDDDTKESKEVKSVESKDSKRSKTKLSDLSTIEKFERQKEQMKSWRSKNPEYNKTYRQKYYAEHRDEILEKRRMKRLEERKIIEAFKMQQSRSEN